MSNFIAFTKHETTGSYLNLNYKKGAEYILDVDKIDFMVFDEQC